MSLRKSVEKTSKPAAPAARAAAPAAAPAAPPAPAAPAAPPTPAAPSFSGPIPQVSEIMLGAQLQSSPDLDYTLCLPHNLHKRLTTGFARVPGVDTVEGRFGEKFILISRKKAIS
jgi:hypothetical protein